MYFLLRSDVVHSNTDAGNEEQETNNNKLMNLETELSEMEEEASDNDDDRYGMASWFERTSKFVGS